MEILDTWLLRVHESGVVSCMYDFDFSNDERVDSCNQGWFLYKIIICCELLREIGISTSKYENVARGVCDFYLRFFPNGMFPQMVTPLGKTIIKDGCAGTMLLLGFIKAYDYFKDGRYLERGKSAFNDYYLTYLCQSVAAGGALDTYCIDKESAGPVLRAALLLYKIENDVDYLLKSENIAHYLMTWCFYHNIAFDKNSDSYVLQIKTSGGTAVSVAHHHIDCWGLYYVPDLYELSKLTGNNSYENHAKALWNFTTQYISD